jgi:hypothetical protein
MTVRSPEDITAALAGITDALRVDGYALEVEDVTDTLSLRIRALEDACEDCLVPEGVMAQTISGALKGSYRPDQIRVAYPAGASHSWPSTRICEPARRTPGSPRSTGSSVRVRSPWWARRRTPTRSAVARCATCSNMAIGAPSTR